MHQVGILQSPETFAVVVLASGVQTVVVLADVTRYYVAVFVQTAGIILYTYIFMTWLQVRHTVVQHEQAAVAGFVVELS